MLSLLMFLPREQAMARVRTEFVVALARNLTVDRCKNSSWQVGEMNVGT